MPSQSNRKLKSRVRAAINRLGWDLARVDTSQSPSRQLARALGHLQVELVLDVGANTGQYGQELRKSGYRQRIVSFEPLPTAYAQLLSNTQGDAQWRVHPRCAIGNHHSEVLINVSQNSVSSSIRSMLPIHEQAEPSSKVVSQEAVELVTLDSVFPQYVQGDAAVWLKVDTQGFEKEVLEGATLSLPRIKAVQLELSLVALYAGQDTWEYFLSSMSRQGYRVWSFLPGFSDPRTGQTLQVDAVFVRP
jgi:FkbM family methyltransferase